MKAIAEMKHDAEQTIKLEWLQKVCPYWKLKLWPGSLVD